MKQYFSNKGESLAETMIALSILAIGITLSALVVSNALTNMSISRNRVVAVNIAREGLEAMRNIRDTNWLKFSDDRRICWNHTPGINGTNGDLADDFCNGTDPLLPGDYIIYKNDEYGWKLEPYTSIPDNSGLYEVDIDPDVDTDNDGNEINDADIYNHIDIVDGDPLMVGGTEKRTPFKRVISIAYLENVPTDSPPSNDTPPDDVINTPAEWLALAAPSEVNRMLITTTVTWQEANRSNTIVHNVDLQTILTDYLGRDNLSS